jgi:hypothetical protein
MQRFFKIVLIILGATLFEMGDALLAPKSDSGESHASGSHHQEQLVCNNRHNIDIEHTSTIAIPSAQTIALNNQRHSQLRHSQLRFHATANIGIVHTIADYPISPFTHRLGTHSRAIDFYLYMLCQLRL